MIGPLRLIFWGEILQPGELFPENQKEHEKYLYSSFFVQFSQKKLKKLITTRPRYYLGCYVVAGFLKIYCP
jgi:hypothetical protein